MFENEPCTICSRTITHERGDSEFCSARCVDAWRIACDHYPNGDTRELIDFILDNFLHYARLIEEGTLRLR